MDNYLLLFFLKWNDTPPALQLCAVFLMKLHLQTAAILPICNVFVTSNLYIFARSHIKKMVLTNSGIEVQDTTIVIAADIRPVGTQFI